MSCVDTCVNPILISIKEIEQKELNRNIKNPEGLECHFSQTSFDFGEVVRFLIFVFPLIVPESYGQAEPREILLLGRYSSALTSTPLGVLRPKIHLVTPRGGAKPTTHIFPKSTHPQPPSPNERTRNF